MTDSQKCVTRYSHHLHSPSVQLSFQVKDKLGQGLLEYVASTTSHDHKQLYNDQSLINIGGVTTSGLKPCKNMIILIYQVYQSFRIT
jgi:hypothetical protein